MRRTLRERAHEGEDVRKGRFEGESTERKVG